MNKDILRQPEGAIRECRRRMRTAQKKNDQTSYDTYAIQLESIQTELANYKSGKYLLAGLQR